MQFKVHFLLSLSEQNVLSDYGVRLCSPDASWHIDDPIIFISSLIMRTLSMGLSFCFVYTATRSCCHTFVLHLDADGLSAEGPHSSVCHPL